MAASRPSRISEPAVLQGLVIQLFGMGKGGSPEGRPDFRPRKLKIYAVIG